MAQIEYTLEFGTDGWIDISFDCEINEQCQCYDVESVQGLDGKDLSVYLDSSKIEDFLQREVNTLESVLHDRAREECGLFRDDISTSRRDYYGTLGVQL